MLMKGTIYFIDKSQTADAVQNALTVLLINIVMFKSWLSYSERASLLARKYIEVGISPIMDKMASFLPVKKLAMP